MLELIREWRDAREAIFRAGDNVKPEMFDRLGSAELALMTWARINCEADLLAATSAGTP